MNKTQKQIEQFKRRLNQWEIDFPEAIKEYCHCDSSVGKFFDNRNEDEILSELQRRDNELLYLWEVFCSRD